MSHDRRTPLLHTVPVAIGAKSDEFSPEQGELWMRVDELWRLAVAREEPAVRAALHPAYIGWDSESARPHDREFAVHSVCASSARVVRFDLRPMAVEVYDETVGVVHYTYRATVSRDGETREVAGRWTEVYLKQRGNWLMITVAGGPERAPAG